MPHLTINLSDVRNAGGVSEAIFAACREHDSISSGYSQTVESAPTFAIEWRDGTSIDGYADRAFAGGALHYIDSDDGRMVSQEPSEEGDEDATRDLNGEAFVAGDWSEDSVVALECPDFDDAMEHPDTVALMAQAVIDHHGACSNRVEWKKIIVAMKEAAEAVEDIDADKLDD